MSGDKHQVVLYTSHPSSMCGGASKVLPQYREMQRTTRTSGETAFLTNEDIKIVKNYCDAAGVCDLSQISFSQGVFNPSVCVSNGTPNQGLPQQTTVKLNCNDPNPDPNCPAYNKNDVGWCTGDTSQMCLNGVTPLTMCQQNVWTKCYNPQRLARILNEDEIQTQAAEEMMAGGGYGDSNPKPQNSNYTGS